MLGASIRATLGRRIPARRKPGPSAACELPELAEMLPICKRKLAERLAEFRNNSSNRGVEHGSTPEENPMCANDLPKPFGVGAVLPVVNIEAAARFYCEKLGFTLDFISDGHGSVTRHCVGMQFTLAPAGFRAAEYPGWTYIFTEGIDALYAEFQASGVRVMRELESHPHGMREFQIEDQDGFKLRFGQYLNDGD